MKKRKKIILLVVGVSIVLLALIGGSFAYFTANINSDNGEVITGKAVTIVNVNMEYGGVINSDGIYPGHKLVKTIHVTGSGEANAVPAVVTLTLTPNVSDFPNHVRYTMHAVENSTIDINSICGSSQNEVENGKYSDSMECNTSQLGSEIKSGIFIDKQVETLDIRVEYNTDRTYYVIVEYINDTEKDQNSEQGKTFSINLGYIGEEAKPTATIMIWDSSAVFWQDNYRTNTTKIVIEPSLSPKENASETFDVSESQDKSVMAYLVANESNPSKYTLYLQGENGILANPNSSNLFYNFYDVTTIEGIEYLDTSNVMNMRYMFANCSSLTSIDLSPFNTSKVTNMRSMFSSCSSLTSLDLSHFDTSNVTRTDHMFSSLPSNAIVKVRNTVEQQKILTLASDSRPSSWTTSNVVVAK